MRSRRILYQLAGVSGHPRRRTTVLSARRCSLQLLTMGASRRMP